MSQASKSDMSYAAAMIDGEGTFSISRIRLVRNGQVVPNQYQYQLRVTISNSSEILMKWLVEKLLLQLILCPAMMKLHFLVLP